MTSFKDLFLAGTQPQAASSPSGEACPGAGWPGSESAEELMSRADDPHLFSYFKMPIRNIYPAAEVGLGLIYNLITGEVFKKATEALRELRDEKEAREFKSSNFDYVTFSGLFSRRDSRCLKKHSGLLCLDFDHLEDPAALKKALIRDKFFETHLAFISPSGDGLKWIIPIEVSGLITHESWFNSVRNYIEQVYRVRVDGSGRDVARACFLPHDPHAYLNPKLWS